MARRSRLWACAREHVHVTVPLHGTRLVHPARGSEFKASEALRLGDGWQGDLKVQTGAAGEPRRRWKEAVMPVRRVCVSVGGGGAASL